MERMDVHIDHYEVLGLYSGEDGAEFSEKEITKAYKLKALELHPDKRPDDPNAQENFQRLKASYEILKDEKARKLFDDLLRVKREKQVRRAYQDSERQKMVADLEGRERAAFAPDPVANARAEEEMIARKLKEEIARIRAKHAALKRDVPVMATESAKPIVPTHQDDLFRLNYQAYEDSVLDKLKKATAAQSKKEFKIMESD